MARTIGNIVKGMALGVGLAAMAFNTQGCMSAVDEGVREFTRQEVRRNFYDDKKGGKNSYEGIMEIEVNGKTKVVPAPGRRWENPYDQKNHKTIPLCDGTYTYFREDGLPEIRLKPGYIFVTPEDPRRGNYEATKVN